jgi:hypothetical protein
MRARINMTMLTSSGYVVAGAMRGVLADHGVGDPLTILDARRAGTNDYVFVVSGPNSAQDFRETMGGTPFDGNFLVVDDGELFPTWPEVNGGAGEGGPTVVEAEATSGETEVEGEPDEVEGDEGRPNSAIAAVGRIVTEGESQAPEPEPEGSDIPF